YNYLSGFSSFAKLNRRDNRRACRDAVVDKYDDPARYVRQWLAVPEPLHPAFDFFRLLSDNILDHIPIHCLTKPAQIDRPILRYCADRQFLLKGMGQFFCDKDRKFSMQHPG